MAYYAVYREDTGELRSLATRVPGVDGEPGTLPPEYGYVDIGGPQARRIWDPVTRTMGPAPPPIDEDDKINDAGAEIPEFIALSVDQRDFVRALIKMMRRLT